MKKENNFGVMGNTGFVSETIITKIDLSEENDCENSDEKDTLSKLVQILLRPTYFKK